MFLGLRKLWGCTLHYSVASGDQLVSRYGNGISSVFGNNFRDPKPLQSHLQNLVLIHDAAAMLALGSRLALPSLLSYLQNAAPLLCYALLRTTKNGHAFTLPKKRVLKCSAHMKKKKAATMTHHSLSSEEWRGNWWSISCVPRKL